MSMLPIVELRLAVPVSQAMGLSVFKSFIVCMLGNMVPVPFVYFFARSFLEWGQNRKGIGRICALFLNKGEQAGRRLTEKAGRTGTFLALMLFVGIPLPGPGAWTGTLAASILDMGAKITVAAVTLGIIIAGCIMMAASVFGFSLIG